MLLYRLNLKKHQLFNNYELLNQIIIADKKKGLLFLLFNGCGIRTAFLCTVKRAMSLNFVTGADQNKAFIQLKSSCG